MLQEEKKPNIVAKVLAIFEQAICTKLLYASDIGYYEMQACFLACSLLKFFKRKFKSAGNKTNHFKLTLFLH